MSGIPLSGIRKILQPDPEVRPIGSVLLAHCEHVLAKLGEDGIAPLRAEEFKKLRDGIASSADSAPLAANPFRAVKIGGFELNWAESEHMALAELSGMLRELGGFDPIVAHIDKLSNMGVKGIGRPMLVQASWDMAYLNCIKEESMRDRYLATRLKALESYSERKAYSLALGLMEFQDEVIA